ncbi:gliding motility protein GldM [Dysgonomonas sp. 25]|uniref:type IX secretion system motor protein PorM/GldM n=1 Tax=Dysgonomonas sp. 25 TaxID=2302933 RepID=UPI0013D37428|nr:gliding motility protein GldM [Dysgonomonas sp. 25]NDV68014.1 gliding motility protein GldM [Dysgonomonas sp. 25]
MASTRRTSTRQKMINLMYLVFIAMLALRVSTEVLDGFDLMNDNIQKTIQNTTERNNQIYAEINEMYAQNPQKTEPTYRLVLQLKQNTDSVYNYIQALKQEVAVRTDGKDADMYNLETKDDLDAASEIFLSPAGGKGKDFKAAIDNYRENIAAYIADPAQKIIVETALSTEPSERAKKQNKDWLQASFENMPSIAVITYLSELQSNIKQAEGEALNSLLRGVDMKDFRVNELAAYVIPESKTVVRGAPYRADIILAAVDTTQRPKITINGKEIENGRLNLIASGSGSVPIKGQIELMGRDGQPYIREFNDSYTVIDPMAIVEPVLMDVVYTSIDNEMIISVPGFTASQISASVAQGGSLTPKGNGRWIAKPTTPGSKFVVNVSVRMSDGTVRSMGQKPFRVRRLPDPTAFIPYTDAKGTSRVFKQGRIARNVLLNAGGIKASIDDGVLDVPYTVISFRTVMVDAMGNSLQEMSSGANFSQRQLEQIQRMDRGTTFFISSIRAKGPDGERDIAPMEVRVN